MSKSPASPRKRKSKPQKSPYVPIWGMPATRELARELAALRHQEIGFVVTAVLAEAVSVARINAAALIAASQPEAPQ